MGHAPSLFFMHLPLDGLGVSGELGDNCLILHAFNQLPYVAITLLEAELERREADLAELPRWGSNDPIEPYQCCTHTESVWPACDRVRVCRLALARLAFLHLRDEAGEWPLFGIRGSGVGVLETVSEVRRCLSRHRVQRCGDLKSKTRNTLGTKMPATNQMFSDFLEF